MDTKLTYFFRRPEAPRLDPPCYGIECHLVIILAAKSVCTPPLVYTHPRHRVVPDSSAVAAFLSLLEHPRGSYSIFTSVYFFTCALDRCDVLHIYKLIAPTGRQFCAAKLPPGRGRLALIMRDAIEKKYF